METTCQMGTESLYFLSWGSVCALGSGCSITRTGFGILAPRILTSGTDPVTSLSQGSLICKMIIVIIIIINHILLLYGVIKRVKRDNRYKPLNRG